MPEADAELEAKIVPDESAIEEVENRELELGGGGELSPSQENQREGIISGGLKTALLATGIVGLLAQLKPVVGILQAIFGVIGRSLVPIIEVIAELLRPFNEIVDTIGEVTRDTNVRENLQESFIEDPFNVRGDDRSGARQFQQQQTLTLAEVGDQALQGLISIINNVTDGGAGNPDLSDEGKKTQLTEETKTSEQEKLGATK